MFWGAVLCRQLNRLCYEVEGGVARKLSLLF